MTDDPWSMNNNNNSISSSLAHSLNNPSTGPIVSSQSVLSRSNQSEFIPSQQQQQQAQQQSQSQQQVATTAGGKLLLDRSSGGQLILPGSLPSNLATHNHNNLNNNGGANGGNGNSQSENEKVYYLIVDLMNPQTREGALLELSKKREQWDDLALVLWHSFGSFPFTLSIFYY